MLTQGFDSKAQSRRRTLTARAEVDAGLRQHGPEVNARLRQHGSEVNARLRQHRAQATAELRQEEVQAVAGLRQEEVQAVAELPWFFPRLGISLKLTDLHLRSQ